MWLSSFSEGLRGDSMEMYIFFYENLYENKCLNTWMGKDSLKPKSNEMGV